MFCTILDYKFSIDTGASPPVCCRNPTYSPHEKHSIMTQIKILLENKCIRECGGSWDSTVLLTDKPRQEDVDDIKHFFGGCLFSTAV